MNLREFWSRYRKNKLALVAAVIVCAYIVIAVTARFITPYSPFQINLPDKFSPPSTNHLLGTDQLGRDVLSRIIFGTQISLFIGLSTAGIATVIGIAIGSTGAYLGGWFEEVTMRVTDFVYCLPTFFLVLTMIAMLGPNLLSIILVMGVSLWPLTARLMRAEILSVKEKEYVTAARVVGMSGKSILFSEILPNALYSSIVNASLRVGLAVLYEASLSFLGLGDPNLVSWGWIVHESLPFIRTAWWIPISAGIVISILVLSVNLVGDGLNDALNPQLKER